MVFNSDSLFCKQRCSVNEMARPQISKTELGQRLTEVRRQLGYEARLAFADLLGMNAETLGGYERGDSEPPVAFMAMYHRRFGVNVSWLVSGQGSMFGEDRQKLDMKALRLAIEIVDEWLDETSRTMTPSKKAEVVAEFYGFILEDVNSGSEPLTKKRAGQFLRLVTSR